MLGGVFALLLAFPVGNSAQTVHADDILKADSLHQAGELISALEFFQDALATHADDVELLWRTAREAVAVGVMAETIDEGKIYFDLAIEYAETALELDASSFVAEYWLVAAQGLRARHAEALIAARLGTAVYERSRSLLERDSLHAGANHALGALNLEVMRLSRIKRFIAVTILGNRAFRDTSWENAETHLVRSVQIDSTFAIARLDLGRAFFYQGELEAARAEFENLLQQPLFDPTDVAFHDEARNYLQRISQ